jgi:Putative Ig domain
MRPCNYFSTLLAAFIFATCLYLGGCTSISKQHNAVQLTPSTAQTMEQGTMLGIAASVLNDTSHAGVTWTLSGAGSLSSTTPTGAFYNAPTSVTIQTTASVTATSVAFPSESASLSITIVPAPSITTTSLSAASINAAYSATINESGGIGPFTWSIVSGPSWLSLASSTSSSVNLTGTPAASDKGTSAVTISVTDSNGLMATSAGLTIIVTDLTITTTSPLPAGTVGTTYSVQFAATGGTSPYTWSVASGSTLPAGLSLSSSGLLSGTPTAMESAASLGITVTDSEATPVSVTTTFTLTIAGSQNTALLSGSYAFEFSGFNSAGAVIAGGSFTADGQGRITSGVEDMNSMQNGPQNQTFTGTYTLGTDGRGQLVFSSLSGSPTYDFAIDSSGAHGRMIEADSTGIKGSGELELQSVSTCSTTSINGEYAFGLSGNSVALGGFTAGPVVLAGRVTATPPTGSGTQGNFSSGEMDGNTPGEGMIEESLNSVSGTFQSTSQTARCTATITPTILPSMTFSVYPVSSSWGFLVEVDNVNSTIPTPFLTVGTLQQQVGVPFNSISSGFTGTSVAALRGQFLSGSNYVPDVAVASLVASGSSNFQLSFTENRGGSVTPFSGNGTFINADTWGRVATQGLNSNIEPVFYMINTNKAFAVGSVNGDPLYGLFEPQSSGPFSASTIKGTLIEGTLAPDGSSVPDFSGVLSFDGTSTVSGTEDSNTGAGLGVTGTYALTSTGTTDGSGTVSLKIGNVTAKNFTGSFYIVTGTTVVMISTTSGDQNPVAVVIGD